MYRVLFWLAAGLLLAAGLVGCESGSTTPTVGGDRATAVAQRADAELTLVVIRNATATVTNAEFARVKPLLDVHLSDGGSAGAEGERVQVQVINGDKQPHEVVIRIYDHSAPLNSEVYHVGALTLGAGAGATTVVTTTVPFADARAQVLQIDNVWDYGPPPPQ